MSWVGTLPRPGSENPRGRLRHGWGTAHAGSEDQPQHGRSPHPLFRGSGPPEREHTGQHTDGFGGRSETAAELKALGLVPLSEGEDGKLKKHQAFISISQGVGSVPTSQLSIIQKTSPSFQPLLGLGQSPVPPRSGRDPRRGPAGRSRRAPSLAACPLAPCSRLGTASPGCWVTGAGGPSTFHHRRLRNRRGMKRAFSQAPLGGPGRTRTPPSCGGFRGGEGRTDPGVPRPRAPHTPLSVGNVRRSPR